MMLFQHCYRFAPFVKRTFAVAVMCAAVVTAVPQNGAVAQTPQLDADHHEACIEANCDNRPIQNNRGSGSTYAAVAISPSSLDTGTSWSAASQSQAEQLAVQLCAKQHNSNDCKPLMWARDACVAIAVSHGTGHNDGRWGQSWNANRAKAISQAISLCNGTKNKDCKIQQSACPSDP
jgi:Domain of unknown function (DUF4189)